MCMSGLLLNCGFDHFLYLQANFLNLGRFARHVSFRYRNTRVSSFFFFSLGDDLFSCYYVLALPDFAPPVARNTSRLLTPMSVVLHVFLLFLFVFFSHCPLNMQINVSRISSGLGNFLFL